jgi:hypothetical protein
MTLGELRNVLRTNPDKNLRFLLPDGDPIPAEFHVTEVGHVGKNFIDCGGASHASASCVLQIWVAENDGEHRLTAGKLAGILELARKVLPSEDLDVEVEYEGCVISQYPVQKVEVGEGELTFALVHKHTDCLDKEACGLQSCGCGPARGQCC